MLIRDAGIGLGAHRADVRIAGGRIAAVGPALAPERDEPVVEAQGGVLLPGLHDQHLHLRALAVAQASVPCGPPQTATAEALLSRLHAAASELPPGAWLRGIGYHDRVAGAIDRDWLDRHAPQRPIRIQHRSGRRWIFNTLGLRLLEADPERVQDDPLERIGGRATGVLHDADGWLSLRLPRGVVSLHGVSARLARFGVTAVTDATPRNDIEAFRAMAAAQAGGEFLQDAMLMGDESLDRQPMEIGGNGLRVERGATKFHLHDADLGDFDAVVERLRRSHLVERPGAFHCVTRGELIFALAAIEEAGPLAGDRIEHASITPPEQLDTIVRLGLRVVAQPNFVGERGDAYLDEVDADDQPWLYRLRSFIARGVPLSGSTDAPFGDADPWAAMRSAVTRRAPDGRLLGIGEALSPEEALRLFAGHADAALRAGCRADLCLLDRPWSSARERLRAEDVRLTLKDGRAVWSRD